MHVKKGDKVQVITGKDKGKQGVILVAFPKQNRVIVEGVNIVKKHSHVSNVMILDPKTGEPTRVGFKVEDGKKVRIAKKSGELLDK